MIKKLGFVGKNGRWPCSVCGEGVGANSIQCIECGRWVHKRCSDEKQPLRAVEGEFVCRMCRGYGKNDEDLNKGLVFDNGDCVESVDRFCYLGNMLNSGGGVESASIMRVRCAWAKFRELSSFLTQKEVSLKLKDRVYATCIRSTCTMLYGSETWAMNAEQMTRFDRM